MDGLSGFRHTRAQGRRRERLHPSPACECSADNAKDGVEAYMFAWKSRVILTLALFASPSACVGGGAAAKGGGGVTLRNWNGIGIKAGPDCGVCCGLVFPKGFGTSKPELTLLREIAEGKGRATELGCTYANKLEVFEYLVRLAVEENSDEAAL